MKKNLAFPFLVTAALAIVVLIFIVLNVVKNASPPDESMIFFFGNTCPHCVKVEEFFTTNNVEEKISFEKREISSPSNQKIFIQKAEICGIPKEEMGVPLLWDGTTCFKGDADIINYFKTKLGL